MNKLTESGCFDMSGMGPKVDPSFLVPTVRNHVKPSEEVDSGNHPLFSAKHLEPHKSLDGIRGKLCDSCSPVSQIVSKKFDGRHL